jgi:hypothetical protein
MPRLSRGIALCWGRFAARFNFFKMRFETEDHSEVPVGLTGILQLRLEGYNLDQSSWVSFYTLFTLEKKSGAVKNFRRLALAVVPINCH